jgi:hypothetical protein
MGAAVIFLIFFTKIMKISKNRFKKKILFKIIIILPPGIERLLVLLSRICLGVSSNRFRTELSLELEMSRLPAFWRPGL